MNFQKRNIFRIVPRTLIGCSIFILYLIGGFFYLPDADTFDIVVYIIMVCSFGFFALIHCMGLSTKISEYRYVKDNDILGSLVGIPSYASDEEMRCAFRSQQENCLYYDDGRLIITKDFLADTHENYLFLLNGILDLDVTEYRTNTFADSDRIVFTITYLDGEQYTSEYRKEDSSISLYKRKQWLTAAAKIISSKSVNFHKHIPPKV